jgi:transcription initiation factor TFIIB
MVVIIFKAELAPSKIAEKLGVSDGTIKTSYKFLYENKEDLIDQSWIESGKIDMDDIPKN